MISIPGTPALQILNNFYFNTLFLPQFTYAQGAPIFEVSGNPHLPSKTIEWLQKICPKCKIDAGYDCGLTRPFTVQQLVAACAGKLMIRPAPGHSIQISSKDVSEAEMNAFCSKAVYMEVCIDITKSSYKRFTCPHLKELRSCAPGRPAITVVNNAHLGIIEIPTTIVIPRGVALFTIYGNPLISETVISKFRRICKNCRFPKSNECVLQPRSYTDKELVAACAGKSRIAPQPGFYLTLSSKLVTEEEMNAFCSKATYMEICIEIIDSSFTSLRCPLLKELKSCRP
ncbi:unnamed protein product, partial [Strongylus vulgaris]